MMLYFKCLPVSLPNGGLRSGIVTFPGHTNSRAQHLENKPQSNLIQIRFCVHSIWQICPGGENCLRCLMC